MYSILIVNNENTDKSTLYDSLKTFKNVKVEIAEDIQEALELFNMRYFEILFLDTGLGIIDNISKFKQNNPETIVVCNYENLDEDFRAKAIKAGVRDCLENKTDVGLVTKRVSNYIELAQLKKERLFHADAINLFAKNIYQRFLTFKLNSNTAKAEFSDYFADSYFDKYANIQESLDVIYAFVSWMFLNHRECEVIKETSQDTIYLTLQPIDFMSEDIVSSIIKKYDSEVDYLIKQHKLSLRMQIKEKAQMEPKKSNVSKLDDTTKDILAKTHFNKTSAAEFVASTAIEFIDKIEDLAELEDAIDNSLLRFEDNATVESTHLLSQSIIEYTDIVKLLMDFDHLVFGLVTLAEAIDAIKQEQMTPKEVKKFTTLMLHLLHDLSNWRKNIFIKQEANDIHYLDSSLLSSCLQIEAIFEKEKIEEDEDDFELF